MKNFLIIILLLFSVSLRAQEEAAVLHTPTGDIYGTLTVPISQSSIPVVLIIAGSGPTDRDGNQPSMQNNSLKMLSEFLRQNGIATLRFDKRGIAASKDAGGKEEDLRFDDYVNDASLWIDWLSKDSRFSDIIVAGHSEGSLIGMLASEKNAKVKSFISIAGSALSADEIIKEQMKNQPPSIQEIVLPIFASLKQGELVSDIPEILYALCRPSVQPYIISWMKYNPQIEIQKLTIPLLILQGTTDIQVTEHHANLLSAANPKAKKVIIKNMNHILKDCSSMLQWIQLGTYTNPELPLNEEFTDSIIDFIRQ